MSMLWLQSGWVCKLIGCRIKRHWVQYGGFVYVQYRCTRCHTKTPDETLEVLKDE